MRRSFLQLRVVGFVGCAALALDCCLGTAAAKEPLWSLQPIADPQPPDVKHADWPESNLDRFVLARLEEKHLQPVRDADPLTLLRRVYFDVIGLPPSPEEIADFRADYCGQLAPRVESPLAERADHIAPEAYAALVDRLLASPQFGERWGRHWLDVARYAESNGKSRDVLMPQAWRYRDYVIDAVGADLPYDRFITEQIAGDLLPAKTPEERDRLQIATGFLAIGSKTLVGGTQQMDLIDEQIDVVGKAVLGLTVSCARCHDHKFDPIPTRDYYAMAGIFLSTKTLFGGGLRRSKNPAGKSNELVVLGGDSPMRVQQIKEHAKAVADLEKQRGRLQKKLNVLKKKLPDDWKERRTKLLEADPKGNEQGAADQNTDPQARSAKDKQVLAYLDAQDEFRDVQAKLNKLKDDKPPELEFAVGVRDAGKIQNCRIHIGGEQSHLGDEVPRGFLSSVTLENAPEISKSQSGRLELAQWLTHPDNPLTPRVAVNRIWLHLFGRGIVGTVDNFGSNGERPTHPQLLDYLARRFLEHGWSTKRMIREIVLSRTYRLSSEYSTSNAAVDPGNTFYWRMSRRRLEAEAIRDALLAVSGQLDLNRPEASAVARIGNGEVGRGIDTRPLREPFPHRSVYLPILRGRVPPMLKVFDYPEPSNPQGQRDTTTVPAQSLYLMNNPFVIEQAERLAERVMQAESDDGRRVELAYTLCFGRLPRESEKTKALNFLRDLEQRPAAGENPSGQAPRSAWSAFCQALFASAEFRYVE